MHRARGNTRSATECGRKRPLRWPEEKRAVDKVETIPESQIKEVCRGTTCVSTTRELSTRRPEEQA